MNVNPGSNLFDQGNARRFSSIVFRSGLENRRNSQIVSTRTLSIQRFREIVDGKHDDVPEQAFYMVGTIEEVLQSAEALKKA